MTISLGLSSLENNNGVGNTVGQDFNVTFDSEASQSLAAATADAKNGILNILGEDLLNLYKTRTCVRPQVVGEIGSGVSIKYFPSPMLVLTGSNQST